MPYKSLVANGACVKFGCAAARAFFSGPISAIIRVYGGRDIFA